MKRDIYKIITLLLLFSGCAVNNPQIPLEDMKEVKFKEPEFNSGEGIVEDEIEDEDLVQTNELEIITKKSLEKMEISEDNPELEEIKIIKINEVNKKQDLLSVNDLYLTFYFDYNSYILKNKNKLKDLIKFLKKHENEFEKKTIVIEGNADQRGTDEYNYALGIKRAHYIKEQIIFNTSVLNSNIKIISYGETNTVCTEETEDCYARNRRVEIYVK